MKGGVLPSDTTFNHEAARENARNRKHIQLTHGNGVTSLMVNKKLVTYNGTPAELLSDEQKKKLTNRLLFMYLGEAHQMPLVLYV